MKDSPVVRLIKANQTEWSGQSVSTSNGPELLVTAEYSESGEWDYDGRVPVEDGDKIRSVI